MPDIRITMHYQRGDESPCPYVVAHVPVPHGTDPQDLIEELAEEYTPDKDDHERGYYEFISPPTAAYSGKTTVIRTDLFIDLSFKVVQDHRTK